MTSHLLNKLIEFKTISNNFISIQQKFSKSAKNVLNIDFNNNSVIDCINVCRSDLKIIEFNQNSKKLKCFWPKCQFTTNTGQNLKRHQIIHKNIKLFKCEKCFKRFNLKHNLIRHQLIHKNIKPFECKKCNKRFRTKIELKRHESIHSNKRQFVCNWNECGKRYNSKSNLTNHKNYNHLNQRKYVCDYNNDCNKRFQTKQNLNNHKRIHSGEKPFVCKHKNCGKKFNQKSSLKTHIKSIHKILF